MSESEKIAEWSLDKCCWTKENRFIKQLRKNFTEKQICIILDILDDTCLECFDNNKACYCMRDD